MLEMLVGKSATSADAESIKRASATKNSPCEICVCMYVMASKGK